MDAFVRGNSRRESWIEIDLIGETCVDEEIKISRRCGFVRLESFERDVGRALVLRKARTNELLEKNRNHCGIVV